MKRVDTGTIVQLQNFSVNDGEGIRTTIFMMGCPLRCKWCSNPETWSTHPQKASYLKEKLVCASCGYNTLEKDIDSCPECNNKLNKKQYTEQKILGYKTTTLDIIKKIKRQEIFYRHSNGGVTFSGGEPIFQQDFFRDLVYSIDDLGIDMTIETSGYFIFEQIEDCLEKLTHIFYDIKVMDDTKHIEYTGVSNKLILDNIIKIKKFNIPITIRVPFIMEVNTHTSNINELISFINDNFKDYPINVELLPYHNLGLEKYNALNINNSIFTTPDQNTINETKQLFINNNINIIEYR